MDVNWRDAVECLVNEFIDFFMNFEIFEFFTGFKTFF